MSCAFSETLADVTNNMVDTELPIPAYRSIAKIPITGPGPPHTCKNLSHID